jgi:hypothetical protein
MHISEGRVNACLALASRERTRALRASDNDEHDLRWHRAERFDDRAWSMNELLPDTAPLYN